MAEDDKSKKDAAATQAEPEDQEEGDGAEEGAKKKKKLIVIGAVSLLFIIAAGAGFFLLGGEKHPEEEMADGAHQEMAEPEAKQSFFYELPDMTVNLSSAGARFLRLKIVLEINEEPALLKLKEIEPRLMDDFQVYLRELRPEDLKGSAGSYRLRHDLLLRVNQAAQPISVQNVLFKEFLVQ